MAGGPHERTAFLARPAPFFRNFSGANADGRRAGKDIEKVEIHVERTAARGAPLGAAARPAPGTVGDGPQSPHRPIDGRCGGSDGRESRERPALPRASDLPEAELILR